MTDVSGVVEAVTDTGMRVDATWYSKSKFRPVVLPPVGTFVKLQADAKNFIFSLDILEADTGAASTGSSDRSRDIRRQVAAKVAGGLLAAAIQSREDARIDHFARVADLVMSWLEQKD